MAWEVNTTDSFRDWYEDLGQAEQEPIMAAVELLIQRGPNLKRPYVGEVLGSRIHNLKELIPPSSSIRILFCFDPRSEAILLVGADKAEHGWTAWYPDAIAEAERAYDDYLDELRREGLVD